MTVPDLASVRAKEFPWADQAIYLDAASYGPLPERALRAVDDLNRRKHDPRRLTSDVMGGTLARAREAVARLIGATTEEIALTSNTNHAINLAAGFLRRADSIPGMERGRRRILVTDREFPANIYPWLALQRDGMILERVETDDLGRPREDALIERLETADDIAAFSVSAVQFATGFRADLRRIGRICRERGILFIVDAIQAAGIVPIDVRDMEIDILACGGQKWLCSPFGTGFAFVRRELVAALEPDLPGWLAFTASSDFCHLVDYGNEYVPDARRFEVGTLAFQDFAGLAESATLLHELGPERILEHVLEVQEPLIAWARERDDVVLLSDLAPERRSGIVCFRTPDNDAVAAALADRDVRCVVREGAIRLSPHFYNTVEEMEQVVTVLQDAIER